MIWLNMSTATDYFVRRDSFYFIVVFFFQALKLNCILPVARDLFPSLFILFLAAVCLL